MVFALAFKVAGNIARFAAMVPLRLGGYGCDAAPEQESGLILQTLRRNNGDVLLVE